MTDSYREHRPLLCDDYSDEEFDVKNYNNQRRNRISSRSGRARNYAKGAAAVITRWPDNCSTSVAYWWLGVSMIAITIFVIYNSVLIFGMIPTSGMKQPKYRIFNNEVSSKVKSLSMPDIFMHLFVNNSSEVQLNKYLPYTTNMSKRYANFNYKLCVMVNDTLKDFRDYKDEERNDIAFNSLWASERVNTKICNRYNISVEYISLTAYLNDSPIKKFWRHLPPHLIEFLVRSISIWEKGGIAFNPEILMSNLYSPHYTEKLYGLLDTYVNSSSMSTEGKVMAKFYPSFKTKRPNNIQDIIKELGKFDNDMSNFDLSEAENKVDIISNADKIKKIKRDNSEITNNIKSVLKDNSHEKNNDFNETSYNKSPSLNSTQDTDNILPLFLKYLFENKSKMVANPVDVIELEMPKNNTAPSDTLVNFDQNQSLPVENIVRPIIEHDDYKDNSTVTPKSNTQTPVDNIHLSKAHTYNNVPDLSLDIKGNIIASKTACHAFLGTMFSNSIQHTEEKTLSDFIISELSLFCNGMLSSCAGVNLILV